MFTDPLGSPHLTVQPLSREQMLDRSERYDWVIGAIGYERRARFVAESLVEKSRLVVGIPFAVNRELSFNANYKWFARYGEVWEVSEATIRQTIAAATSTVQRPRGRPLHVAVDISSLTRQRLADIMLALYVETMTPLIVDWIYSPSHSPNIAIDTAPLTVNGPLRGFEGWGDPEEPLFAVVGAGFEGDLVLGILDDLEAQNAWAFVPSGYSSKHDLRLEKDLRGLQNVLAQDRWITYRVDEPFDALARLSSLASALAERGRLVVIPFGPKLFALISCLVALTNRRRITVWRASVDDGRRPRQKRPNGDLLGLRVCSNYRTIQ